MQGKRSENAVFKNPETYWRIQNGICKSENEGSMAINKTITGQQGHKFPEA